MDGEGVYIQVVVASVGGHGRYLVTSTTTVTTAFHVGRVLNILRHRTLEKRKGNLDRRLQVRSRTRVKALRVKTLEHILILKVLTC